MTKIIDIQQLSMTYDDDSKVINDINLSIKENKIYGLLGRNGAGKTTLMKLITAQIFSTDGVLRVFGEHPYENQQVLEKICFIKESQKYPDNYRVRDVLEVSASLFKNWDQEYALKLVKEFDLPLKKRVKKLSRGMHSAVGIIVGLASRAPLTIFDEPYLGLDAVARKIFYDQLITDFGNHPRTIILSTHLIDEVSNLLEHVIVIDRGNIIIDRDSEELRGLAYTVTGLAAQVTSFVKGKEVIQEERMGGTMTATLIGDENSNEQSAAKQWGLGVSPVSLQQLIVYLTKSKTEGMLSS
ncbi:ABC transporter ATP-binding protein [Lederbergia galactosidilytica]|uniref:Multidrug ABC transporter ATPase n=1 Tax=Lederbergia galactosidilytica TaxID=217031 RepID=A0A178A378_9BACI|nr:ABC transporter ATP-binding protein [Lederbergia galactosidilytica]KRG12266.1 multidrug ABC transporter ATPase [Virgibacillus soli]OAK73970.1 multidrug ABC transporter ATPase [Lederbergia galactosidilytica]